MANHEQEATEYHLWTNNEDKQWWKADAKGYTRKRSQAGRFSLAEALEHCCWDYQWKQGDDTPRVLMIPAAPRQ